MQYVFITARSEFMMVVTLAVADSVNPIYIQKKFQDLRLVMRIAACQSLKLHFSEVQHIVATYTISRR
jgi:hypothetical protein